jgi:serine O-acetyltransferase
MREEEKTLGGLFELIREDYRTHRRDWTLPGFRAVVVYRFGVWVRGLRVRLLRAPLSRIYNFLYRYVRNHYAIELPSSAKVGRRVVIGHQGGIVVHWRAEIGDDCLIRQNVTLGAVNEERVLQAPILGNRVEVGCGAAIIGAVHIGENVRIGPNAVVTVNIPADSTVVASPARIVQVKTRPMPKANNSQVTSNNDMPAIIH